MGGGEAGRSRGFASGAACVDDADNAVISKPRRSRSPRLPRISPRGSGQQIKTVSASSVPMVSMLSLLPIQKAKAMTLETLWALVS